jgi:putative zinc-binding metallo-peptidase
MSVRHHHSFSGIKWLIASLILLCMASSCHKEAGLSPTPNPQLYTLPQGNQPYDAEILQFYHTYSSIILYKFNPQDFLFNYTINFPPSTTIAPADTNYVQQSLNFLHANWWDLYPSVFLQKTLPFKIFLSGSLMYQAVDYLPYSPIPVSASQNSVAFGLANDSLQTLSPVQVDSVRGLLQRAYWQVAMQNALIERPTNFDSLTVYTNVNAVNANANGIIAQHNPNNAMDDFLDYIMVITSTNQATMNNTWLSPATDINGMYRQKYNLITSYYLTKYGVNLQAMGNL